MKAAVTVNLRASALSRKATSWSDEDRGFCLSSECPSVKRDSHAASPPVRSHHELTKPTQARGNKVRRLRGHRQQPSGEDETIV